MSQPEVRTHRLKAAHDKLEAAVESIVSGDDWQRMLKVASKFHKYSFNNQLMIFLQRPEATHVAGFNRWRSLGRCVRKGEKGIAIFAPCRYKTKRDESASAGFGSGSSDPVLAVEVKERSESTEDGSHLRGFRVVHVFDISQTEGEPIADLDAVRPKLLDGEAPEGIWDALVAQANDAGYEVIREQKGSANGYCDFLAKRIAVRPGVSDAQALKTLIHELAHALLHTDDRPKTTAIAEVEVESVAHIVCDALGLDTSDYSFAYVARWSGGEADLVKQSAERVISCAKTILTALGANTDRLEGGERGAGEAASSSDFVDGVAGGVRAG